MKVVANHIVNTREVLGAPVLSLMAWIHQVRRWCVLRHLRRLWEDNQHLRQIARERHWDLVLSAFNVEYNYRFIKAEARTRQQKGIL